MKKFKDILGRYKALYIALLAILASCEGDLEPVSFSEIDPSTFLQTEKDAISITNTVYNRLTYSGWTGTFLNYKGSFISDMVGGQMFIIWSPPTWVRLNEFTWTANSQDEYAETYWAAVSGATYATSVIEDIKTIPIDDAIKNQYIAEIRGLRAFEILNGYDMFGPLPLVVDPEIVKDPFTDFFPDRWTNEQTETYIEDELLAAESSGLRPASELSGANYGRFSIEASKMARLKLYMMQKDWAKAVSVSDELMAAGFALQPTVGDVFSATNERNSEIIWAQPRLADTSQGGIGTAYVTSSVVGSYATDQYPAGSVAGWGGLRVPWETYDSFDDTDERKALYPTSWLVDGVMTDMRANGTLVTGALFLKYDIDPARVGPIHGNDFVYYRLADAMMLRAEALNEVTPLSAEAIQLVQQIRDRSNAGPIPAEATASQSAFRDFILEERRREFVGEGWARQDLIRHGKFLEFAQDRALVPVANPEPKHRLFPIPQNAITENPQLGSQQNPGY